jgi:hypothetical protein
MSRRKGSQSNLFKFVSRKLAHFKKSRGEQFFFVNDVLSEWLHPLWLQMDAGSIYFSSQVPLTRSIIMFIQKKRN